MSLLGDEKSIKIDLWALRGCHRVSEYRAVVPDLGASAPRAGPARVLSVNKNCYSYVPVVLSSEAFIS